MQNFRALGASLPEPRASGGWGLCFLTQQPPVAGGFAITPPLASGGLGLRPQTPQIAIPLRISGYAPAAYYFIDEQLQLKKKVQLKDILPESQFLHGRYFSVIC